MVSNGQLKTAAALAALVAAAASLSACEERAYPTPAHEAHVAPPKPVELAGSGYVAPPAPTYVAPPPVTQSYSSTTTTTTYDGGRTVYQLPPVMSSGGYGTSYGSSSSGGVVYDLGPVVGHRQTYSSTMTHTYSAPRPRTYAQAPAYRPAPRPPVYHAPMPAPKPAYMAPPKPAYMPPKPMPAPAPHYGATAAKDVKAAAHSTAVAAGAAATMAAGKAADAAHKAAMAAQTSAAKYEAGKSTTTTTSTTKTTTAMDKPADNATGTGDRATRLAALQTALTDAVSAKAALTTPAKMNPNQPVDVSLVLPADFADTVRKAAEKNGLADAAASVNMTALLAGDGYSVTPDETQSQPLTVGQPTEFHWTVTAQPNAKGPLHADVGADLLGGGSDTLSLGTVQKGGAFGSMKMTPRMLGAAILALIVILVLGWLARGRSGPSRSASARRASRRARGGGGEAYVARPLDMGGDTVVVRDEH